MSLARSSSRRQFVGYTGAGVLGAVSGCGSVGEHALPGAQISTQGVGEHELPDLPYAYDVLEPHVDQQTMRLHHQKHHGGALRGLNRTEKALAELSKKGEFGDSRKLCRALAYFGSSHVLHSIFWTNMKPKGGGAPEGELAKRLKHDFGSVEAFKSLFLAASNTAPAAGWGMLAFHPGLDRLMVLQVEDHEKLTLWGAVPLLVCDVWEHAYYLKYQNRRKAWTSTFLEKLVSWENVGQRLASAR